MIASLPPLRFPKRTTREATAEAVRVTLSLLQHLAYIYDQAKVGRDFSFSPENKTKWAKFLFEWSCGYGSAQLSASSINFINLSGSSLSFFPVAVIALEAQHPNEARMIYRGLLASEFTSVEEFDAYSSSHASGLVAAPAFTWGGYSFNRQGANSSSGSKPAARGKPSNPQ